MSKGYFVWHDLFAPDPAKAAEFYQALFGWRLDTQDMGTGPYTMFGVGETLLGGFGPAAEGPPRWMSMISSGSSIISARFTVSALSSMPGPLVVVMASEPA